MRDEPEVEHDGASSGGRRQPRTGHAALLVTSVAALLTIGYLSALAVHWHEEARRIRDRMPVVVISNAVAGEILARDPLPSSPRSTDDLLEIQRQLVECVEQCSPATVAIAIMTDQYHSGLAGSGVVVTEDGYVLTAGHVSGHLGGRVSAEAGLPVAITFPDGSVVNGETLGMSVASDTGMIKITDAGTYPFVPLARAGDIEIGEWCLALGFPGGYDRERGAVARIGRLIGTSLSTIRTDCKLLGGDSGGPLFNLRGELIGIHSRISDSPDENYHAPISAFHRGWQDLQEKQVILFLDELRGGFLGIKDCAPLEDDAGLLIREVATSSPAAACGIIPGDILTHIDNQKIIDRLEYSAAVESKLPGEHIALRYRRGARSILIDVVLGAKPDPEPNSVR